MDIKNPSLKLRVLFLMKLPSLRVRLKKLESELARLKVIQPEITKAQPRSKRLFLNDVNQLERLIVQTNEFISTREAQAQGDV